VSAAIAQKIVPAIQPGPDGFTRNQSIIYDCLRILTTKEIDELTSLSVGTSKTSLTDLLCKEYSIDLCDISHLNEKEEVKATLKLVDDLDVDGSQNEDQKENVEITVKQHIDIDSDIVDEVDETRKKKKFFFSEEEKVVVEDKMATVDFILEEKERLSASQKKLKGREIMDLYAKSASVSIEQEKKFKNNLQQSSVAGVLVNKKQS